MIRVAINGYGRIGRVAHRVMLQKHAAEIEVVAINAGHSTDLEGWMYLLKYDTSYGQLEGHTLSVEVVKDQEGFLGNLIIDDKNSIKELSDLEKAKLEQDFAIDQLYYSNKLDGTILTKTNIEEAIHGKKYLQATLGRRGS